MSSQVLTHETLQFLDRLSRNNNRVWFEDHKADYLAKVKKPSEAVLAALTDGLSETTGAAMTGKQFRINRDVRFSKDKTPYNTHIRMAFWADDAAFQGRDAQPPSFFLSVEPGRIRLGAGCMTFSKQDRHAYLQRLLEADGGQLVDLLCATQEAGFTLADPDLKKVPSDFPKDHPCADLARHKGLAIWQDLETEEFLGDTGIDALLSAWQPTLPVWRWLSGL